VRAIGIFNPAFAARIHLCSVWQLFHDKDVDISWQDAALGLAGVIGSSVAVIHGILVQRLMVKPFDGYARASSLPGSVRRLVPLLLHFSTVSWFFGGLALLAACAWFEQGTRAATGFFVGSLFLFGALANLWGTRGRHPGWLLMAVAVALILVGVNEPVG
jgi:hypothetical protein